MPELSLGQSALLTDISLCVNRYRLLTPGIYVCVHAPVILGEQRITPGLVAQINYGVLKQCEATAKGFIGPPNFIIDVFNPGELEEYEKRKALFEEYGVKEYIVLEDYQAPKLHWNRFVEGKFQSIEEDQYGMIKSHGLPGFWLSTRALAQRDWWTLLAIIERGTTRLGHHDFQDSIWHEGREGEDKDSIPYEAG